MLNNLALIVPCMGRLEHLKQSLPLFKQFVKHVVVIDYSCPQNSGKWAQDNGAVVVGYSGQKYFNICKARNLGAIAAQVLGVEWFGFIDADMLINEKFEQNLKGWIDQPHDANVYFAFPKQVTGYAGTVICRAKTYYETGGWDAEANGYGYDDTAFKIRLAQLACHKLELPMICAEHIAHNGESRVEFYEEKDMSASYARNLAKLTENLEKPKAEPERK